MITPLPSPFGERDLHKCFIMLCVYLNLQAIKREPLQKQIFLDISHTHTQKCFQFNRENVRYCYHDYIYLLGMSGPTLL